METCRNADVAWELSRHPQAETAAKAVSDRTDRAVPHVAAAAQVGDPGLGVGVRNLRREGPDLRAQHLEQRPSVGRPHELLDVLDHRRAAVAVETFGTSTQ